MLSVILPTFNESENIRAAIAGIAEALIGRDHEIIIVDDDSPDETWKKALKLKEEFPQLEVLRRIGRRGLSSAVLEGFAIAKGERLAVMDADGQHDTAVLPFIADAVSRDADIAIGSRYIEGGSVGQWDERRYALSRLATKLALKLCSVQVKDPMSGFFAIKRSVYEEVLPRLNPKGFKILLDFLVHVPRGTRVAEVPLHFLPRTAGQSKLNAKVQFQFLEYLYDVTLGRYLSPFRIFCLLNLIIGIFLAAHVWNIRLLYLDASVRRDVQATLTAIADQQGGLLSDYSIRSLQSDSMILCHHSHARLMRTSECRSVPIKPASPAHAS